MDQSKLSQFLADNKIDTRRLIAASYKLERLRPEDRRLRHQKRAAKGESSKEESAEAPAKPRSGRPISTVLLDRVNAGKAVPGPAKQRILRALNHVLEQKKKDNVDLRAIF